MKLLTPARAPLCSWLTFVPLATACVQLTDFDEPTAGSDGSTSSASSPESSGDDESSTGAGESATGSAETSDPPPPGAGDSSWLQLGEQFSAYYGVAQASDGRVRALGEEAVEDLPEVTALARLYSANGDSFEDLHTTPDGLELYEFTAACERPDGGVFLLAFLDPDLPRQSAFPLLVDLDSTGSFVSVATYTGINGENYPPTVANVPRLVCDADGRAWVALSHIYANHPSVLLARFDTAGFDGYEQLIDDAEGDHAYELFGLGRDDTGNIHLAIRTGAEPASGEALVRWLSYDADGVARPEIALDAADLPSTLLIGFAARGSRVVVTTVDTTSDLTWIIAYDIDGAEQWRTSALPSPAEGWIPGPVDLASDGSVVMMAEVGEHPDQSLGLVELDAGGALRWSAEYPFAADGEPQLDYIRLADLDVGPDVIDVVGSTLIDGGDRIGWVRRVLR